MRNHTTPKLWELRSQQGKTPTVTPGAGATDVSFLLTALPTGKDQKFWYYASSVWLEMTANITVPADSDLESIDPDYLWQILQSVQVQCPLLGALYQHSNTRGAVLGLVIQYVAFGFNALPINDPLPLGATTSVLLIFRIPFTNEYLRKPHETAPWTGFLEGGTIDVKVAPASVISAAGGSTPANVVVNTVKLKCNLEMFPSPEAVIHTPCHWREHITPGGSPKHVITDMGSPDGLQGIDQSKGVGIAGLYMLTGGPESGLALDSTTNHLASNVLAYDFPLRDQTRIDSPEFPYLALYEMMGNNRRPVVLFGGTAVFDGGGFPYLSRAPAPNGTSIPFNSPYATVFPLIAPGRDTETSKLQTVAGAKEINFQYTVTPTESSRFVGQYYPQWDEQFARGLAARINPAGAGDLTAKTLNKQTGGVRGVGKLAYTRTKVK